MVVKIGCGSTQANGSGLGCVIGAGAVTEAGCVCVRVKLVEDDGHTGW